VRSALELRRKQSEWDPPVLLTIASQGDGVGEVIEDFERHRRQRLEQRLRDLLRDTLVERVQGRGARGVMEGRDRASRRARHHPAPSGGAADREGGGGAGRRVESRAG
jgi:putative protein kinase ArgK-like GTPase of G3E family